MKYIDLINKQASEIEYEIFKFNDGEPHIKFTSEITHKDEYTVIARITNSDELFIVLQVCDVLDRHCVDYKLYLTYLMGMRMDRVMTFNEAFSLKIIADMFKNVHPKEIYIFEPHSEKTLELLNAYSYSKLVCDSVYNRFTDDVIENNHVLKCYPDWGAYVRYRNDIRDSKSDYAVLEKKRDIDTGNIIGMKLSSTQTSPNNLPYKRIIIIDDLCDGGRTFIEAKKLLNQEYPNLPVDIFVKHMVNKDGLMNLLNNFDHVYITNSYADYSKAELNLDRDTRLKLTVFDAHSPYAKY